MTPETFQELVDYLGDGLMNCLVSVEMGADRGSVELTISREDDDGGLMIVLPMEALDS